MRLRPWLAALSLLLACAGGEFDGSPSAPPPPPFGSPRVAVDLDPRADVVRVSLRASAIVRATPTGVETRFVYDSALPGPTVRAKLGDTVEVELDNQLTEASTLHFHGVHLPYEMDGDGHGQPPVQPGERFVYRFVADRAGTFWYHPHVGGAAQVRKGLFGAFVVDDPRDPQVDDVVLVFSEVPGEAIDPPSHAHATPLAGGYARGLSWLVNGARSPTWEVDAGRVVRARIVNASANAPLRLSWPRLRVIATDQGLLSTPFDADEVELMPGDRVDAEWLVGGASFDVLALPDSGLAPLTGDAVSVLRVSPVGDGAAPSAVAWSAPTLRAIDAEPPVDAIWTFTGSGVGSDFRINGERYPDVTPTKARLNQDFVIELRNLSSSRHPFHLHGHAFRPLSIDGARPPFDSLEDTLAIEPFSTARVLVHPDHAGDWLAHCHFLSHEGGGMMTVLQVR